MDRKSAPRTRTRAAMEFSSFRNAIGMYPEVNEGAFHLPGCRPPGSWLGHSIQARLSVRIPKTQPTSVLPIAREESQRLSAADFAEEDFWPPSWEYVLGNGFR